MKKIPEKCERCGGPIDWNGTANEIDCSFCGKRYIANDNLLEDKRNLGKLSKQKQESLPRSSPSRLQRFIWSLGSNENKDSYSKKSSSNSLLFIYQLSIVGLTFIGIFVLSFIYLTNKNTTNNITKDNSINEGSNIFNQDQGSNIKERMIPVDLKPKTNDNYIKCMVDKNRTSERSDSTEYSLSKSYDKAISFISKAKRLDDRSQIYKADLNFKKAIAYLDKVIIEFPNIADLFGESAYAKLNIDDYEGVIEDSTKSIELNPSFDYNYLNRGIAYRHLGNYKQSICDLTKAIKIDPTYADNFLERAYSKYKINDNKGSLKDLSKAIKLDRKYEEAYYFRGALLIADGKQELGCIDIRKAGSFEPSWENNEEELLVFQSSIKRTCK